MKSTAVLVLALLLGSLPGEGGTCHHAYLVEGQPPPAFSAITSSEPGFLSTYWAWGENPSTQGGRPAGLVDAAGGLAVNPGILWANSDACSGDITGTALLVEARTTSDGGKVALVAVDGAEVDLDSLQAGSSQSEAGVIPGPAVVGLATGSDGLGAYLDCLLGWEPPAAATWALSSLPDPLAGYSLHFRTGSAVDTGDQSQFQRVVVTPSDTLPAILDDPDAQDGLLPASRLSATVRVRPGDAHFFVLSLIFDGSGAVGPNPQADPSAVETHVVSACSPAVSLADVLFADGFESGGTSHWSGALP